MKDELFSGCLFKFIIHHSSCILSCLRASVPLWRIPGECIDLARPPHNLAAAARIRYYENGQFVRMTPPGECKSERRFGFFQT
jgi:hypothetical protein